MSTPEDRPRNSQTDFNIRARNFQHYTALAFCVAAPILVAIPPRKLDIFTLALGAGFGLGASRLYQDSRHGFTLLGKLDSPLPGMEPRMYESRVEGEKSKYEMVRERLKREKEQQQVAARGEAGDERKGVLDKLDEVWMGGEKPGWQERRKEEEERRIAEGEGYGDMIMDQIREVWSWGRKGEGEAEVDGPGNGRGGDKPS